jgi:spore coat polysaccharide biosynthesis protein SpsF
MVERVKAAGLTGKVVVATTTRPSDEAILHLCYQRGYTVSCGHPTDLLDRHYQVGKAYQADVVVKIPSDCPLIDTAVIDRVIAAYLHEPAAYDYVSNLHPATYPDGNDVEVMRMSALETAWRHANETYEREHTSPYLWARPHRFRLHNVTWETGLDYSMSHRWTIDYEEDYRFLRAIYDALYARNPLFGLEEILALLAAHPDIAAINRHLAGVNWYRHHLADLPTISPAQTRQMLIT